MQEYNTPPQAIEIEESILGTMLLDKEASYQAFEMLSENEFYKPSNQIIFKIMLGLYLNNHPIDLLSVEQELSDEGQLQQVGGTTYLSDLTRSAGSASNMGYHAQIIKEKAIKRTLIQKCSNIISECYNPSSDTYDVIDLAQESVFDLSRSQDGTTYDIADTMNAVILNIDHRMKNRIPLGMKTGLDIDHVINGFQNGNYYVLAARPSMGKTAFALEIMRRVAKSDKIAAILSLETSHESLGYRLLAQTSGINGQKILSGELNEDEFEDVLNAATELSSLGIYIDDTLTMSDQQLRSKARQLKQKQKVDLLVIDYVQLLKGKGYNQEQEVANVSRMCKVVAKELDIPVIALAQLSRDVEKRGGDKRPVLSDLRASGQIEQDADVVMFLYRAEYYGITVDENNMSTIGQCEVIISKNKDGAIGTKVLQFDKERLRFSNFETYLEIIK